MKPLYSLACYSTPQLIIVRIEFAAGFKTLKLLLQCNFELIHFVKPFIKLSKTPDFVEFYSFILSCGQDYCQRDHTFSHRGLYIASCLGLSPAMTTNSLASRGFRPISTFAYVPGTCFRIQIGNYWHFSLHADAQHCL